MRTILSFCVSLFFSAGYLTVATSQEAVAPSLPEIPVGGETYEFQAEVNKLMHLIVNSIYRSNEIFLRELVSNASDAIDKLRFLSLTNKEALAGTPNDELKITVSADKENKRLIITDNGIGMNKDDLIKHLGTIAKSGTADFLSKLEKSGDMNFIGQFGVGFYSAFLVADRVTVISRNYADPVQYIWDCSAVAGFTVVEDPRGATLPHGTQITLHLKDDATEFLEVERLENLIKKYSQFIGFPIYLLKTKSVTEEVDLTEEEIKDAEEKAAKAAEEKAKKRAEELEKKKAEAKEGEEEKEEEKVEEEEEKVEEIPKTKKVTKEVPDYQVVNSSKPIWTRDPKDVTEEEYADFYKTFTKDNEKAVAHTHFKVEGEVEFRSLLFIPTTVPDLNAPPTNDNISLFVRHVFITNDLKDFMPDYLSFIKGLVDSDDLPLNVSREILQQHKLLNLIKKRLVGKVLELLKSLSSDEVKYKDFYEKFQAHIKMGIIKDTTNRKKLAKLLRFQTSASDGKLISLDEYLERMKKGQDSIYFLAGSLAEIKASPFLEKLLGRGYEVVYMTEPIDEYMLQSMSDYSSKKFQNVSKTGLKFGDEAESDKKSKEELTEKFKPLAEWWAKLMPEDIDRVVISDRLVKSPCAIVSAEYAWSANMQKLMAAQSGEKANPLASFFANQKKILEINPSHPLIVGFLEKVSNADATIENAARTLYQTTLIRSGYTLADSTQFAATVEKMLRAQLGVDLDAAAEVELVPAPERSVEDKPETKEGTKETKEQEDDEAQDNAEFNMDDLNADDMNMDNMDFEKDEL